MLCSFLQPSNAKIPISITSLGIVMLVNEVQPENAAVPMLITLFGIFTFVNDVQSENALQPIHFTGLPLIVDGIFKLVALPLYSVILTVPLSKSSYS